ncbi:hypothetical protein DFH06DRAFT_1125520 [Mycena polygramma]|nr:hypothetical protein DFH06DRAFT_1125520 [Mycena polygramma]
MRRIDWYQCGKLLRVFDQTNFRRRRDATKHADQLGDPGDASRPHVFLFLSFLGRRDGQLESGSNTNDPPKRLADALMTEKNNAAQSTTNPTFLGDAAAEQHSTVPPLTSLDDDEVIELVHNPTTGH